MLLRRFKVVFSLRGLPEGYRLVLERNARLFRGQVGRDDGCELLQHIADYLDHTFGEQWIDFKLLFRPLLKIKNELFFLAFLLILKLSDTTDVLQRHLKNVCWGIFFTGARIDVFREEGYCEHQLKDLPKQLLLDLRGRGLLKLKVIARFDDLLCLLGQYSEKPFPIQISIDEKRFHLLDNFIEENTVLNSRVLEGGDWAHLRVELLWHHDGQEREDELKIENFFWLHLPDFHVVENVILVQSYTELLILNVFYLLL